MIKLSKSKSKNVTKKKIGIGTKITNIKNPLEVKSQYGFRYLTRPNGITTLSKSSMGVEFENLKIEIDYKLLQAWRDDNEIVQNKDTSSFKKKYENINFDF